ncbi:caspase family protein [Aetokthonos hydrillicola Thurmond2011]|jgi:hypothetical protein|uniref:Caspase family protein n=1 Tax=Aetokthonos hydrillicola Thurmond2011 TaxID=2712845 RepID=A0AAP5I3C1_9CYAN|nr:caspase family protein [Aetokthonos hydrillicola]MBO3457301.1 caspase family protein [Aetokthonos hydrillicola CCALA 1050]MBW4586647.1 caspase family protein [Aetokthonos hydrillicola CCALA 1050]MDR9894026.1 caspase family protein [Aetokthonos hydrillicola Thurmond2011]
MNVSSTKKQRKYLIAIGSPSCAAMKYPELDYVETDIQRVEKLLTSKKQGYERVLADTIYIGATSNIIKTALTTWFASSDRCTSDCVIVYYAGHAGEEMEHNSHYLYTIESNPSNLPNTVIKTSDLADLLVSGNHNSPQNILLILDVCYAGKGAANVLASSLTQKSSASEDVIFCVIASANSSSVAGDGHFVNAFEEVIQDSDWMSQQREFLNPGDLVDHINKFLVKKCGQKAEFSLLRQSTKLTFFRNPCYSSTTQRKSREQIIADSLLSLDYCKQERVFIDAMIDTEQREKAFLVQTDEEEIQSWLVRRLAKRVWGFHNAKKYEIRVHRHRMRINFNYFLEEFQQDIGIGNRITLETVIQCLAEVCEQKSVIIAIYGLSRLDQEKVLQFHTFWSGLVKQVHSRNLSDLRLVLLLAEENNNDVLRRLYPFFSNTPFIYEPIHLTPLESILRNDLKKWRLQQQDVYDSLNFSNLEIESIAEEDVLNWSETPLEMLENICCKLFKIDQGIAAIEPYWKLAG